MPIDILALKSNDEQNSTNQIENNYLIVSPEGKQISNYYATDLQKAIEKSLSVATGAFILARKVGYTNKGTEAYQKILQFY